MAHPFQVPHLIQHCQELKHLQDSMAHHKREGIRRRRPADVVVASVLDRQSRSRRFSKCEGGLHVSGFLNIDLRAT